MLGTPRPVVSALGGLMKFLALSDCPQGQQAGDIFEATEDAGAVLVMVGCAKVYEEAPPEKPTRGRYRRSDLTPESRTLTAED